MAVRSIASSTLEERIEKERLRNKETRLKAEAAAEARAQTAQAIAQENIKRRKAEARLLEAQALARDEEKRTSEALIYLRRHGTEEDIALITASSEGRDRNEGLLEFYDKVVKTKQEHIREAEEYFLFTSTSHERKEHNALSRDVREKRMLELYSRIVGPLKNGE